MKKCKPSKQQEEQEARDQEARRMLDSVRADDCRMLQGKLERDSATLYKIITSLSAAGFAGTSASLAAGTSERTLAAWALGLMGLAIACLVVELFVAMKQAEEYAGRLSVDETGQPGGPKWCAVIDWLLYISAVAFFMGLACLGCSWFFA